MTQDAWLTAHPYLLSVARFHAQVERAVASLPSSLACVPNWRDYELHYLAGIPLLQSCRSTIDLRPAGIILEALIGKLGSSPLPETLAQDIRDLRAELDQDRDAYQRAVAELLDLDTRASVESGLLHYLGWTVMGGYFSTVVDTFGKGRDEERWLRRYCPTCGSPPAMAQLVGVDPGRVRLLYCGCCRTRWQYRRTGCPFCENQDDHRLAILVIDGEKDLRIDHCESCGGYIKTYNGSGNESLLLADWTSLHLDIIARDRGLHRSAVSLYEL
jgi:FdhE protein